MSEPARRIHVIHLLVRHEVKNRVAFLLYPHGRWRDPQDVPLLALPTKKSVVDPGSPYRRGTSIEYYVAWIMRTDLHGFPSDYLIEEELEPVEVTATSPRSGQETTYVIYPIDVWVKPERREWMKDKVEGIWLTPQDAVAHPRISPTAKAVMERVLAREKELDDLYNAQPELESAPRAHRRLLKGVAASPSMESLAVRWASENKGGARYLSRRTLDQILDAGTRAFNLRVADPYLRYQAQGLGFTWSFFTHKDKQDIHMHGAPVVEIYGVLEGEMEVWWKPYMDRGSSAWSHQILGAGDWIEVDSLHCHIVHWNGEGKGVVFKAGPGQLAEVGRLGVKGKTPCPHCPSPCVLPPEVLRLVTGE